MTGIAILKRITHAVGRVPANTGSGFLFGRPCLISPHPMSFGGSGMAGYVKIWTSLLRDEKFLTLTGNQRSVYLQLLLACKHHSDSAQVCFKNYSQAAQEFGIDDSTVTRALLKLHSVGLIRLDKDVHNVITIELPNYQYWQQLTVKDFHRQGAKPIKKTSQKSPTRPDQTKADQTRPEHTTAGKPPCEQIRNLYIEICQGFPIPNEEPTWSPKRQKQMKARWKEHPDLDWWRSYFFKVALSDFLKNGNDSWKGADFGWIMLPSNMEKILEGRYDNKKEKQGKLTSEKDYGEPGEREF